MRGVAYELPLGETCFRRLRQSGTRIYVDKTALIYRLVNEDRFCLLTRPRRFGKSLLLSTIESLFRDGLRYFTDLEIAKLWKEELCCVLYLDLSGINLSSVQSLNRSLVSLLRQAAEQNGLNTATLPDEDPITALNEFVRLSLSRDVVILVDEYDCPVRATFADPALRADVLNVMKAFFTTVKSLAKYCRFMMFSGITRNTLSDEYSCLNFLTDVSLDPKYSTLLGYTEEELQQYFAPYLRHIQEIYQLSDNEVISKIRFFYDGYSFDCFGKQKVYNNWSILRLFRDPLCSFGEYWYESGDLSEYLKDYFLEKSLSSEGPLLSKMLDSLHQDTYISISSLKFVPEFNEVNAPALLFYLGYLTIKDAFNRKYPQRLVLTLPNHEIESSLAKLYTRVMYRRDPEEVAGFFDALLGTLHDYAHLSELASRLELLYNTYSYDSQIYRKEALLRDALYVGCCMHLIPVCREKVNAKGRSDLEISLNGERVVFEFKVASTPDRVAAKLSEASQQMEERSYGEERPEARLTRYSIVVCSATRKVAAITARQGGEVLGRYLA